MWLGNDLEPFALLAVFISLFLSYAWKNLVSFLYDRMVGRTIVLSRKQEKWLNKQRWITDFDGFTFDVKSEDWLPEGGA